MAAGTVTLRTLTQTGATTKGSALTHEELDSNFLFLQSGTGASARTAAAKHQEHPSIEDYSSAGGVADQIQKAVNANYGKVLIARSTTYEVDAPVDVVTNGVTIKGMGVFNTFFNRAFNPASDDEGLFNVGPLGDGFTLEGCGLYSKAGQNAGCLISVLADATDTPSGVTLKDMWLSTEGTDTHKYALYVDGSLKTSGSAVGVREMRLVNVSAFGGLSGSAFLKSVVAFNWLGGGCRDSGGTTGKLVVTGTATVNSNYVGIQVPLLADLDLDRLRYGTFVVGLLNDITNTSNVSETNVIAGLVDGTVQTNWTKSQVIESGRITFPATQNASTGVNTLDDYEEGTWTPEVSFNTPGDLSITYAIQVGTYQKVGNRVVAQFSIQSSAFTHTTAASSLFVSGLPYSSNTTTNLWNFGGGRWGGITKANYTHICAEVRSSSSSVVFSASGSGQAPANVTATDTPTGGTLELRFTVSYQAAT